jgi:hypothetical protein
VSELSIRPEQCINSGFELLTYATKPVTCAWWSWRGRKTSFDTSRGRGIGCFAWASAAGARAGVATSNPSAKSNTGRTIVWGALAAIMRRFLKAHNHGNGIRRQVKVSHGTWKKQVIGLRK